MFYLDATCPLVSKVHKQAMRHQRLGRHVLLIGHAGHPEVVGTMGQLETGAVTLVETVDRVAGLQVPDEDNLGYVTQTTLSVDDTADIVAALEKRFPNLTAPSSESICYATTNRQEAVKKAAPGTDMFLIVGAPNSSNSRRLVEVARRHGASGAVLVQRAGEIDWSAMRGVTTIGVSAGASAPEIVVQEIIDAFRDRFDVTVDIALTVEETENFPVMRDLRDTELGPADMAFLNGTDG
jgi:4-hydroxy-3-methylbut-2-enyl diphosphate reductase